MKYSPPCKGLASGSWLYTVMQGHAVDAFLNGKLVGFTEHEQDNIVL